MSSNVATEGKECTEHTSKKGLTLAGDSSVDKVSPSVFEVLYGILTN